jgi:2-dehydro-3-deoxyphosphogluconate aldolase/(4S)-4-hydroxy-2-oxoglutarate aldolase
MPRHPIEQVLHVIGTGRIIAIVRLADLRHAVSLSRALLEGGITALEFTLTNPQALDAVRQVKAAFPALVEGQAVIGAGTVRDAEAAHAAVEAGAQFIVSPHSDLDTIRACQEHGVAAVPGALTPTEIVTAWEAGASAVKVFPARPFGPTYVKDVLAPLPELKLVPTGGVDLENTGAYIEHGAFALGIGSNLVEERLVAAGAWQTLTDRAREYVQAAQTARG